MEFIKFGFIEVNVNYSCLQERELLGPVLVRIIAKQV